MADAAERDPADVRRYRLGRAVRLAGIATAVGLGGYGLWLGLAQGQWMATGLFGLLAFAALTVGRSIACGIEMR